MNISSAILRLYPQADPIDDFRVQDDGDGPYIAVWNVTDAQGNAVPQPTEAELLAAWEDLQANPPAVPPTTEQRVDQLEDESLTNMLAVAEVYEKQLVDTAVREEETITAMLGLTEAYDLILAQAATIAALEARIAQLEAAQPTTGGTA